MAIAMIVDFSLSNFRSFKDEQLFSMNVERGKNLHTLNFVEAIDGKVDLLKTAAVYGANASGKSNLLNAFMALRWIIVESGDLKEDEDLPSYEPYALDPVSATQPVRFEVEFVVPLEGRFRYEVSFNRKRIIEENLYSYTSRQRAMIFERKPDDTWETIRFGGTYKGGSRRIPFFENNSYLSKAGNSAASSPVIRTIFRYFRSVVRLSTGERVMVARYLKTGDRLSNIARILSAVDTGISEISSEERKHPTRLWPEEMPEPLRRAIIEEESYEFSFWHTNSRGEPVKFQEEDESAGTQRLFNLLPVLIEAWRLGQVVLLDEIEGSFHPHIVNLIVRLFNDKRVNKGNAQLIFTTHDTSILDQDVFRRDQIWFVEKRSGNSNLYSLDEYDKRMVKSNTPFRHWYDEGRFGGLPSIRYGEVVETVETVLDQLENQ